MKRRQPTEEELLEFAKRCNDMGRYFLTGQAYQLPETMSKTELLELWNSTEGGNISLLREKSIDPRHLLL